MLKRIFVSISVLLVALAVSAWISCPTEDERVFSVQGGATLDMGRAEAWEKLGDLSLAHFYVPGLINTKITTDQSRGVGASRRVYQAKDQYMDETVVDWQEKQGFTLRLHRDDAGPPFPFKQAWFTYQLDDHGNEQTKLTTSLRYELSGGPFACWLNHLLLSAFQQSVDDVAANLKLYYEPNES